MKLANKSSRINSAKKLRADALSRQLRVQGLLAQEDSGVIGTLDDHLEEGDYGYLHHDHTFIPSAHGGTYCQERGIAGDAFASEYGAGE